MRDGIVMMFTQVRGRLQPVEKLPLCSLRPQIGTQTHRIRGSLELLEPGDDFFNRLVNSANFALTAFWESRSQGGTQDELLSCSPWQRLERNRHDPFASPTSNITIIR